MAASEEGAIHARACGTGPHRASGSSRKPSRSVRRRLFQPLAVGTATHRRMEDCTVLYCVSHTHVQAAVTNRQGTPSINASTGRHSAPPAPCSLAVHVLQLRPGFETYAEMPHGLPHSRTRRLLKLKGQQPRVGITFASHGTPQHSRVLLPASPLQGPSSGRTQAPQKQA